MAEASKDSQNGTACPKCGAPDRGNLSWNEGLKYLSDTYLLSPRMWPIGYIMQSPYSPLQLEKEMPNIVHWRDAFEDLLALESGNQMISLKSREKEAEIAECIWYGSISREADIINHRLKHGDKYMSLLGRVKDFASRKKTAANLENMNTAIKQQEESSKQIVAMAQAKRAFWKENQGKSRPASSYKMRGQWMASLISSGALPDWRAVMYDSSDGSYVSLQKIGEDPDQRGGQLMTEAELLEQFEEGIPMKEGYGPQWSTNNGNYPAFDIIRDVVTDGFEVGFVKYPYVAPRPAIISQVTTAKCTKSESGERSTKVTLRKRFTDDTEEQIEIVDDASKVLEESDKVYASMQSWNTAASAAKDEAVYEMTASLLIDHNENDGLD